MDKNNEYGSSKILGQLNRGINNLKTIVLFLMIFFSHLHVFSYGQQVTLNVNNASLLEVLDELQKQTGYDFLYNSSEINTKSKITIRIEKKDVSEALGVLLPPKNLTYEIDNNTVLIKSRKGSDKSYLSSSLIKVQRQELTLRGAIKNNNGEVISGATISLKGTQVATSSSDNGEFEIKTSSDEGVLVISSVGYQSKEVRYVEGSFLNVVLDAQVDDLDEVVVIGYGTLRKKDLTGAVSNVNSEKLTQVKAVSNVAQALQGHASGVRVNQASGQPGEGMKISIRGLNSLGASNDPLYVVDGMPLDNLSNQINPDDIENITVLKDASSTAIYGSRGANGVIMITTKSGKAGELRLSYNNSLGLQNLRKKVDLLGAQDFARLQNEVAKNDGETLPWTESQIAELSSGTDWQDLVYRTAMLHSHNVNVSGGSDNTRYYTSFGYYDQDGIIKNSGFKRYSFRGNIEHDLFEKFVLKTNFSVQNSAYKKAQYESADGGGGIPWSTMVMPPTIGVYDDNGEYTKFTGVSWGETNPVGISDNWRNLSNNLRLIGNLSIDYEIAQFLTFKTSLGLDAAYNKGDSYYPGNISLGQKTDKSGDPIFGVGSKSFNNLITLVNENVFEFKQEWNQRHKLDAVAGFTFQSTKTDNLNSGSGMGFLSDIYENNNLGSAIIKALPTTGYGDNKLISYLARANYNYDDRYLLTVTGRYDGSSRFGANNKFAFFPSVAVAWNLTQERFLRDNPFISLLKTRVSYGHTGNQAIGNYQTLANISDRNVVFDNQLQTGFFLSSLENPDLKWETTKQFDVGVELGILNDRLSFVVDYYHKNTDDLLLNVTLPGSGGFSSVLQNVGKVQNKGGEFAVIARPNLGDSFLWESTLNISTNKTKVVDLGVDAYGNPITYKEIGAGGNWFPTILGESMMQLYGYTVEGVYKTDQEAIDNGEPSKKAGDYKFKNWDGEGVVNDADDRTVISRLEPKFTFGFNNRFQYKDFDLSMLIVGSYGNDMVNEFRKYNITLNGKWVPTVDAYNNRYQGDQSSAKYDEPSDKSGSAVRDYANSLWVENGSYLRLRDLTVGFTFSADKLPNTRLNKIRVYLSAQNYLTLTKYSGYDPEVSWGAASINGWDRGNYPAFKSITGGIQVQF